MSIDRIRRELKRSTGRRRDPTLFFVATEGSRSEIIYLEAIKSDRIRILALGSADGRSSPQGVFDRIKEVKRAVDYGTGDSFWLLCDRDLWPEKMFAEVNSLCKQSGIALCTSNERFEVFLCHHFPDFPDSEAWINGEYETFLREKLGAYQKNKFDAAKIVVNAAEACKKCDEFDDHETELWPNRPNSRAYLLISAILSKM